MAATPSKIIAGSQLTVAAATYYTVPANTRVRIQKLTLTNTTATTRTVTLHLVPSGGSAGVGNTILSARAVPPTAITGNPVEVPEAYHVMEAGDTIQALADAATAVTIQASGVLFT